MTDHSPARRLNFFFAVLDDWCWPVNSIVKDNRCFSKPEMDFFPVPRMPTMEGLAKGGIAFWNAIAAEAACTPARHSFWTGYTQRELAGKAKLATIQHPDAGLRTILVSLATEEPRRRTLFLGKTGIGISPENQTTGKYKNQTQEDATNGKFLDPLEKFLREDETRKNGFAVAWCPVAPHAPFWHLKDHEQPEYEKAYDLIHQSGHGTTWSQPQVADHYASVETMDHWLEEAICKLRKYDYLKDTVIVVTADHGAGLDESKAHNRLAGVQQVLIFNGPEAIVAKTGLDESLVMHVDTYWTVRELAGLPGPYGNGGEGRSLVRLLANPKSGAPRQYQIINRGWPGQEVGIRDKHWSYYENPKGTAQRMFELNDVNDQPRDILEEVDVLATDHARANVERLHDAIATWKKTGIVPAPKARAATAGALTEA